MSLFRGIVSFKSIKGTSILAVPLLLFGFNNALGQSTKSSSDIATNSVQKDSIINKHIHRHIDLEESVITGQYSETAPSKSVNKIKVIDTKRIQLQGAYNLQQLLSNELNVRIVQDPLLGSSMQLQGIGGNNIKILVDGVPMIGRENGNIDLTQINLKNVARIEFVEGPMSVSFGTDALGGVLNIITKKQATGTTTVKASTYYESMGQYNADIGVGYANKNWAVQANAGRYFFQGWSSDPDSRVKLWKPRTQYTGDVTVTRFIKNGTIRWTNSAFTEKVTNRGEPSIDWSQATAFDQYFFTRRYTSSIFYDHQLKSHKHLNLLASYNRYDRVLNSYQKDLVSLSETLIPSSTNQDTSTFQLMMSRGTFSNAIPSARLNYQLGYEANAETGEGSHMDAYRSMMDASLFGSAEYKAGARWVFRPALRLTKHSIFSVPVIPSLNLKYSLSDKITVRASYGKGFRAPSLKELYLQFVDLSHNIHGNPLLKPEQSDNFQCFFTYENREANRLFKVEPSLFYNNIQHMISLARYGADNNSGFKYFNLDAYKSTGFNLNTEFRKPRYSLVLGYGLTASKSYLSEAQIPDKFFYTNEFRGNFSFRFDKPMISLSIFFKHNGKLQAYQFLTESNQATLSYINPYSLMDISMNKSFIKKHIDITLGVKNVMNVQNINASFASGPHSSLNNSAQVGMGRTVFIGLKYTFEKQHNS